MLNKDVLARYKYTHLDAASAMPDLSGKQILMGFWHNWASEPGQGYQQGRFAEMSLTDIPESYNVVAVAFMKGSGIPTFKPYNLTDSEFRAQVGELNAQGRAVLISLGGADAHIELHAGQEEALAYEIIRLVEAYGFDGLDIDLEQSAITHADNRTVLPAALRMVRAHYQTEGKHFIISMAPEFPYLRDSGAYLAYIKVLEDIYDFIAPQYYNQGGDGIWVDELNAWITQNSDEQKKDFLYYLTDSLIHGTRGFSSIPADRLVIGLPTNNDAAATGYVVDPQNVKDALTELERTGNPIRGLMTWSVNWDNGIDKNGKPYLWEFATRYGYITGGVTPVPDTPSVPARFAASNVTAYSATLTWNLSTGSHPILQYDLFRYGVQIASVSAPPFEDTGLDFGTPYLYQIRATDTRGIQSELSDMLQVTTEWDGEPIDQPEPPQHLHSTSITANSISLAWEESESLYVIQNYLVFRDGVQVAATDSSTLYYVDRGLTASTNYQYFVAAKDIRNLTSLPSDVLSVSTADEGSGEAPEWKVNVDYRPDDPVMHQGMKYKCIHAHRSNSGWQPNMAVTLWQPQ